MPTIQELNERRALAAERVRIFGMANRPTKPEDRLKADAAHRLAADAWARAEYDYSTALSKLSTEELTRLANPPANLSPDHGHFNHFGEVAIFSPFSPESAETG